MSPGPVTLFFIEARYATVVCTVEHAKTSPVTLRAKQ